MYLLFGGVIKVWLVWFVSELGGLVGWSCPITRKKKNKRKVLHRERRARAKAKVGKFRRRALAVALVGCCRRRPSNKPPPLVSIVSFDQAEPMRWKWKSKKVGLASVISRLEPSTLDSFCAAKHDFLRLPQLLKTLCNHDYHVKQIKLALA